MNQESLQKAFSTLPLERIAYFAQVVSTNDVAADWAKEGLKGPAIVVADEQTKGRGRAGRSWFTPPGSALALSLLLFPPSTLDYSQLGKASGLGALALCEGLEAGFGLRPEIKWPNDVLLDGKKVCGVLAEAHWRGEELQALILGIGINIAPPSVPPPEMLNFPATSLESALGSAVSRMEVLQSTVEHVLQWLPRLHELNFIQAWEARLAYRDQAIRLLDGQNEPLEGHLLGLRQDGSLEVSLASGEIRAFQAGEIQLRPLVDRGSN